MAHAHHFLIVDDEPALLHLLKATLEYGGYTSDNASTALEALQMLNSRRYDAVLLDLSLPDVDGAHLLKEIRASSDVAVIIVSGRGSEQDKVATLDLGADDFIEKPFLPGELLARIRAVLRRSPSLAEAADYTSAEDQLFLKNRPTPAEGGLRLAPLEERLLKFLEARQGEVATTAEIARVVWGLGKRRGENHVRVLVAQLRRKLEAEREPLEIENERGAGYRLTKLRESAE